MIRTNILGQLLDAPRQDKAMAQRAKALQDDSSFWVPGVEPNRFACLPLWRVICVFKGMDPAHWALTSPVAATSLERYTTGEVAARLKELVQLHTLALSGITMGRLKAPGNETKGFETDMVSLIEWAEKVDEVRPEPHPMKSVANSQTKHSDLDAVIEKPTPAWLLATGDYIVTVMKAQQANTVKKLYRALEAKAGSDSPFDKGTGQSAGRLYVRDIAGTLSEGTLKNFMPELKKMATR